MARPQWDIFCSVVDNYGDAGVCWRLARQLVHGHGQAVCLWIDRPAVLARLCPALDSRQAVQAAEGVTVRHWQAGSLPSADAAVVIEAFGCTLPEAAVQAMAARPQPPLWINLEYLSAEAWVEGAHALPSVHPATGLRKVFFFPGFTAATGGLLRAQDLELQRQAFLASGREAFLQALGVPRQPAARLVSLFCYPQAPAAAWLQQLAAGPGPVTCLLTDGPAQAAAAAAWGGPLPPGQAVRHGALTVLALPFLDQDAYDRLLWCCDLNAVRGEDSFVQAQWAGRPLLWHIYPQAEAAHEAKLDAFLARYTAGWPPGLRDAVVALQHGWNRGTLDAAAQAAAWQALPHWQQQAEHWRQTQAAQPDLASKLVQFYTDWL